MTRKPALTLQTGIPYGTGSGRDLLLDVLWPDVPLNPPRPAVIWVHGGGWRGGDRAPSPNPPLAGRGFVTASISYRFSDEAIFPAQIHDVKAAIRFLRANATRWSLDPERIGIWGGSAGGHLAALAAVSDGIPALEGDGGHPDESSAVQAAAALAAPTNLLVDWSEETAFPPHPEVAEVIPQLLGGDDYGDPRLAEQARLASPDALATAETPPMLVVHGTLDDLVPVAQGRRLVTTLLGLGVDASLLDLPNDDHSLPSVFGMVDEAPLPAMRQILDFFVRTLGPVSTR